MGTGDGKQRRPKSKGPEDQKVSPNVMIVKTKAKIPRKLLTEKKQS